MSFQSVVIDFFQCTCAACQNLFYEFCDSEKCPHCGAIISSENIGQRQEVKISLDTKTGELKILGCEQVED